MLSEVISAAVLADYVPDDPRPTPPKHRHRPMFARGPKWAKHLAEHPPQSGPPRLLHPFRAKRSLTHIISEVPCAKCAEGVAQVIAVFVSNHHPMHLSVEALCECCGYQTIFYE